MGYCRIKKMISWENVGWVVGSRVAGEVYGEWFHFFSPTKGGGWVTFMENFIVLSLPQIFVFYSEFRFLEPFPIHISFVNSDPGKLLKRFAGG